MPERYKKVVMIALKVKHKLKRKHTNNFQSLSEYRKSISEQFQSVP
jgi:hypothetical protein